MAVKTACACPKHHTCHWFAGNWQHRCARPVCPPTLSVVALHAHALPSQPLLPYLLKDVRKELPVPQYEARYTPTSPAAAKRGQPASAVDVHTGDATAAHDGEQGQLEFGLGHETVTPSPESSPSTPLKVGVGVHMQKRTTLAGLAQTAVLCMKR
ncbi:hypothetical protein EVJ58_g5591 [Rhodofomes roseus]|uniref:Uncharacterized protein n=1 Tax=Rhodofomes roseus TaxID=34475 RepID=A0A4Y9YCJ1_9APHY|nr:hypothetical protein EVJ58_g5591 [Rhodofomes roseus]